MGCRLPYGCDGNETGTVTALEQWWQDQQTELEHTIGVQLAIITDDQIAVAVGVACARWRWWVRSSGRCQRFDNRESHRQLPTSAHEADTGSTESSP